MNQLTIIGNLTRDPETRTIQSGINVCSFTVAVNRRNQEGADFFRVSAWRQLGDNCQKYLSKGRKVAVVGSVSVSTYQAQDGTTRASMEVIANNVEFLTSRQETGQANETAAAAAEGPVPDGMVPVEDEEIPF